MTQNREKEAVWESSLQEVSFFSGSAVFALLMAVILHELGHALALYLAEGELATISFNPFVGAVTSYQNPGAILSTASARFISAGGVTLGSVLALLLSGPFLIRYFSLWTVPLAMVAVVSMAGNGMMLVLGSLMSNVGDVTRMVALGIPRWVLMFWGIFLLVLGLFFFLRVSPYLGLGPRVIFRRRCFILLVGLSPYVLCVLLYNFLYNVNKIGLYCVYVCAGLALGVAGVYVGGRLQRGWSFTQGKISGPIDDKHVLFASILAVGVLALLIWKCRF